MTGRSEQSAIRVIGSFRQLEQRKLCAILRSNTQINPARLTAVAYAEQKPIVANSSEENRGRNRRIEVMIVTGESEPPL